MAVGLIRRRLLLYDKSNKNLLVVYLSAYLNCIKKFDVVFNKLCFQFLYFYATILIV